MDIYVQLFYYALFCFDKIQWMYYDSNFWRKLKLTTDPSGLKKLRAGRRK
jgi:hypothetical protein